MSDTTSRIRMELNVKGDELNVTLLAHKHAFEHMVKRTKFPAGDHYLQHRDHLCEHWTTACTVSIAGSNHYKVITGSLDGLAAKEFIEELTGPTE